MRPGQEERIEFEYIRHGTQCLIASFHVVTGESIAPTVGPRRTEEDFLEHCKRTVAVYPESSWRFVVDQLNTHCSESLVLWGLAEEGRTLSSKKLGVKGKSGILKSQVTRKSVSIVTGTLHPVYLRSQAQLMAQPSGDLVQRCRASRAEAGQLSVGRIAERTPARLYRLLQQDDGQTLSVDLHRQAIDQITNCP